MLMTIELYDDVRGVTKKIIPNKTDAQQYRSTDITSFDSDGFH
jgi:hypothetical protein